MYKEMYLKLFRSITRALEQLQKGNTVSAGEILKESQRETEEMFIQGRGKGQC